MALLVSHELPGSSQILDGVELFPLTNHCISNDTFVHDGKLNAQVSVTISSPSSTYAIDGTGTRANGKSIFCETEKKKKNKRKNVKIILKWFDFSLIFARKTKTEVL